MPADRASILQRISPASNLGPFLFCFLFLVLVTRIPPNTERDTRSSMRKMKIPASVSPVCTLCFSSDCCSEDSSAESSRSASGTSSAPSGVSSGFSSEFTVIRNSVSFRKISSFPSDTEISFNVIVVSFASACAFAVSVSWNASSSSTLPLLLITAS